MKAPRISEIFGPTIQGEGYVIGQPTIFVRTGGCDFRCAWCDTMFAVDPKHAADWKFMEAEEICLRVVELSQGRTLPVTLSGGNPAMQPLGETCKRLKRAGYSIILETQGTIIPDWLEHVDIVSVSPKPPSAKVAWDEGKFLAFMRAAGDKARLKIVIADEADFEWARYVANIAPKTLLYLQPCNLNPGAPDVRDLMERYRWLAAKVVSDGFYKARVLPQLHALAWGGERAR